MAYEQKDWRVGDEVAVHQFNSVNSISTVARITKRFVELADGSKWGPSGGSYPRHDWGTTWLYPADDDARKIVAKKRLVHTLSNLDWRLFTIDEVEQIRRMTQAAKSRAPTKPT